MARRMRVDFAWIDAGLRDKQLEAVQRGDADIAMSAIVMTPEREQAVDFSLSYFHSGLQIMVRTQAESPILLTLLAIPWVEIGKVFAAAIVLMFLRANVLWFLERRRLPERIGATWRASARRCGTRPSSLRRASAASAANPGS